MELRMELDDRVMSRLKDALGAKRNVDVVNNALTILNWAIREMEDDRVVFSADQDGRNIQKLMLPDLEFARMKKMADKSVSGTK